MTKTHKYEQFTDLVDYLVDGHCHLHKPWFTDLREVINRATANSVGHIINCASDPRNYTQVLESANFSEISATLGIQPTLSQEYSDATVLRDIDDLSTKIVAIGEIGLDYYWVKDPKIHETQKSLFIDCLNLANELDLPVVIHSRKAESDSMDILEHNAQTPVLLHSFDGNLKEIERAKDLGYLITVPTIVTRRKNRRKVALRAGLDHIVIETDAPFSTISQDIEMNEPMYIRHAAEYLCKLLEVEFKELQQTTTHNALKFHRLI